MKKTILLFILALSYSCTDMGSYKENNYKLVNKNGVNIKIYAYSGNYQNPVIILNSNDSLNKKFKTCMGELGSFKEFFKGDSIKVIYQNEKINYFSISGCSTGNEGNPFCHNNGVMGVFTFTLQDYENATPCNGNCE